ncbi:MAG: SGNH/GDSL hydrolase family protein, partial [Bacteroidota bacterium]
IKLVKTIDGVFYCSSKISYDDYTKRHNLNSSHSSEFFSEEDKFHPSKLAYQIWAKDISNFIVTNEAI